MLWNSTPIHERDKGLVLKRLHSFVLPNHSLLFYYILWNHCTPYGIKLAYGNWLGIPGLHTILSCVFQIHAYILDIFQIIYKIYFLDDQTKTRHKQYPLLYGSSGFFFFFNLMYLLILFQDTRWKSYVPFWLTTISGKSSVPFCFCIYISTQKIFSDNLINSIESSSHKSICLHSYR